MREHSHSAVRQQSGHQGQEGESEEHRVPPQEEPTGIGHAVQPPPSPLFFIIFLLLIYVVNIDTAFIFGAVE